jgi:hypothetical protein
MNNKPLILKTFNKQMNEFIEDITLIFPNEKDIIVLGTFMKTIMYGKPRSIIEVWYNYVSLKYSSQIEDGEIDYFANKDYSEDLGDSSTSKEALNAIDKLRATIKKALEMNINREKTIKYVQNITKLAKIYYSN